MSLVEIIVDDRERALASEFTGRGIPIERRRLALGDIIIRREGGVLYVLERKTRGDLHASLLDGRFHDQRSRLSMEYPGRCGFVIEGDATWDAPEDALLISTAVRDGIPIFWSAGVAATVTLITRLSRSNLEMRESPENHMHLRSVSGAARSQPGKRAAGPLALMLQCIRGVSAGRASAIADRFGSMRSLCDGLGRDLSEWTRAIADISRDGRR